MRWDEKYFSFLAKSLYSIFPPSKVVKNPPLDTRDIRGLTWSESGELGFAARAVQVQRRGRELGPASQPFLRWQQVSPRENERLRDPRGRGLVRRAVADLGDPQRQAQLVKLCPVQAHLRSVCALPVAPPKHFSPSGRAPGRPHCVGGVQLATRPRSGVATKQSGPPAVLRRRGRTQIRGS
jgi:hypothetical protein